jgi:hypothetical protein
VDMELAAADPDGDTLEVIITAFNGKGALYR